MTRGQKEGSGQRAELWLRAEESGGWRRLRPAPRGHALLLHLACAGSARCVLNDNERWLEFRYEESIVMILQERGKRQGGLRGRNKREEGGKPHRSGDR